MVMNDPFCGSIDLSEITQKLWFSHDRMLVLIWSPTEKKNNNPRI